jgi:hypothetical protein
MGAAASSGGGGVISLNGQIGRLKLGTSSETDVSRFLGPPVAQAQDNFQFPGAAEYNALGYSCSSVPASNRRALTYYGTSGGPYCQTVYYINQSSQVLGSFWTTSPTFHTSHGTHVGVTQQTASRRERRAATTGCLTGIFEISRAVTLHIGMYGGTFRSGAGGQAGYVGGRVGEFAIDSRRNGVGILFC